MDAIDEHPLEAAGDLPAWQLLGFSAANPAGELQEAGVLPLLMLLSLLERAPHLASRLLTAALGGPLQQQQQQHPCGPACLPPFRLAEVAVEVTRWALRLLGSGGLSAEAQRLGCVYSTAGGHRRWWQLHSFFLQALAGRPTLHSSRHHALTLAALPRRMPAELFFAGGIQCFLAAWESVAAASVHGMDGRWASRLLLAVLVQAQQEACGNVRAVVMRQQRAGEGSQFS